jgi:hypothetical protein
VPILWYSKRQNTVKMSTFGSEFIVMKAALWSCRKRLGYKLWMFGVPIDGATDVFCDNLSVVTSSTLPELTPKRSITRWHMNHRGVCEAGCAAGTMIQILKEPVTGDERLGCAHEADAWEPTG